MPTKITQLDVFAMTDAPVSGFVPALHGKMQRIACPDVTLAAGGVHVLPEAQAHHLRNVLRAKDGENVRAFNAVDGEWLATLRHDGKRGVKLEITTHLRAATVLPDIWLVASPLKKDALDMMVEKASELGASRFIPVIADHTVVHRLNSERAQAQAMDAAEQCERFDIMAIDDLQPLAKLLENWPQERTLYVALERSAALPFLKVLRNESPQDKMALLIGPEGGFSPAEREYLLALPFVTPVSRGETILRAETAAVTALSLLGGFLQAK